MRLTLPRLYAILDIDLLAARQLDPLNVLDAWLDCGVRLVQLRAKALTMGPMLAIAEDVARRASGAGATLFVNDRADVARLSSAHGVHLGQNDLSPQDARRILRADQLIGLSTHNLSQVRAAVALEAEMAVDYVAIGPVSTTSTKANPDPVVGLGGVRDASTLTKGAGRPLVAIGGITLESAPDVISAGADSVAVISDLLTGDWRTRAARYVKALH